MRASKPKLILAVCCFLPAVAVMIADFSWGLLMAPFVVVQTLIGVAVIWFILKLFRCSRRTRLFTVLVISVVFSGWMSAELLYTKSPSGCFKRHFGTPIPASVTIKAKLGYTALAGSSEYLFFSASEEDLLELAARRDMVPVELYGKHAGRNESGMQVYPFSLERELRVAEENGLQAERALVKSKHEGLVYYLLLIDSTGTNVMCHYSKS